MVARQNIEVLFKSLFQLADWYDTPPPLFHNIGHTRHHTDRQLEGSPSQADFEDARMAKAVLPSTWELGFRAPSSGTPWVQGVGIEEIAGDPDAYICLPSKDVVTSSAHNHHGINTMRTWPTLYDGTNSPHGLPSWWNSSSEVDVLICGGENLTISRASSRIS